MTTIQRLCVTAFLITGLYVSASDQKTTASDVLLTVGGEVDIS